VFLPISSSAVVARLAELKPSALICGLRWRRQALVFWLSRWTAIHRREARCLDELIKNHSCFVVNNNSCLLGCFYGIWLFLWCFYFYIVDGMLKKHQW
jgi:hypothetical protein